MVSEARRKAIRTWYRLARIQVDKTQQEVEALARMGVGRYQRIETGVIFPTLEERVRLARVLKVNEADLPTEQVEAKAS